ncbi:hypothetical protein BH23GEM2_BH23GEM2_15910 [soil metagenome]
MRSMLRPSSPTELTDGRLAPISGDATQQVTAYPYTIDNGAGEKLTFVRLIPNTSGGRLEGENLVSPGAGPPMHVHFLQEEA